MMRLGKILRGGTLTDLVLLAIFVTLAYVFIHRRGYMGHLNNANDGAIAPQMRQDRNLLSQTPSPLLNNAQLIDERIRKIPDARPRSCKDMKYDTSSQVSLIIDFFDYQFYDLKTTMSSILHHTPIELVKEIIVVDDGSTMEYIKEDSKEFVSKIPKAKLVRIEEKSGSAVARSKGAEAATSPVLVFLDTNVICNTGWLLPLLDLVRQEPSTVAVPHYDSINDPVSYEYVVTKNELASMFSWSYTLRMWTSTDPVDVKSSIKSPVMRGNVFAIRGKFLKTLGGFDTEMNDPAAEILEFSFRTWLCGGNIRIIPCSRVGILNLNDPLRLTRQESIHRVSELWLGSHKTYVYNTLGITDGPKSKESKSITSRKSDLQHLNCKTFDWYLSNIATHVYKPSKDAVKYGVLKCRSGNCLSYANDTRMELGTCHAEAFTHPPEMIFEITKNNQLRVKGKCLAVKPTAYVLAEDCVDGETKQLWKLDGKRLRNLWSQYCLMHVTDPDKKVRKGRQIGMAQDCSMDPTGQFGEWDFITT